MKKGIISPVFKYIFVLIAGAVILTFFVIFAVNMSSHGNLRISAEVAETIEDSLKAYSSSLSSYKVLDTGSKVLIQIKSGKIIVGDYSKKTKLIIFAPEKLKGDKFHLWTQRLYYPYSIVNLFYITNLKDKYYLVYDQGTEEYVTDLKEKIYGLPNFEIANIRDVGKIKEGKVVFVTARREIPGVDKIISVNVMNKEIDFGEDKSSYLEEYMLLGGIICGDKECYEEMKQQILDRIHKVSSVYLSKVNLIKESGCNYSPLLTNLNRMKNTNDLEVLEEVKDALINANNNLQGDGCSELF